MAEILNHCEECGQDFYYAPNLHECAHKGRVLASDGPPGESWVDECMRKQRDGIRR
jgi:hypothetical protein